MVTKPAFRAVWTTSVCATILACLTALGHLRAAGQEPQQPTSTGREARGPSVKSKADLRARTGDEKARAKFFDRYGAFPLEPGDVRAIGPGLPAPPLPPGARVPTYEEFLGFLACSAPLVALGRAEERATHLNQRETYLFTDYDVDVERWIRPRDGAPSVKLSVSGGRVTIAGRPTIAGDHDPLDPMKRYLFLLQPIPGSGSLTPTRPPLADGDPWSPAIRDLSLIPETASETIRLDSVADGLARLGRACPPPRVSR
jgi:hypothetical protein